jgi:hypothetical protein
MRLHTFVSISSLFLFACGGSSTPATTDAGGKATCEEIIEQCHPLDTGSGEIHECHEFAEAATTTEADCVAMKAHCEEVCVASDAGTTGDAGTTSDAGAPATDAGH